MPYMTPDHPEAYLDMPVKPQPERMENPVICPKCQGHGGWHLELNFAGRGQPFNDAACNQCNGWGWVRGGTLNETCVHEFDEVRVRMSVYKNVCRKCGHTNWIDSSD